MTDDMTRREYRDANGLPQPEDGSARELIDVETTDERTPWLLSEAGRRYLYSVAAALLVVVGAYLGIDAADRESWLSLVGAILNVGGAGALTYAQAKVKR